MPLNYAQIQVKVGQLLQDPSNETYDVTEIGYWIEESLKEFATYDPHIVDVIFKIESRYGTETAGTSGSITDTTKSQFLAADATLEKVIHNTTDNTWAVVTGNTDTTANTHSMTTLLASGDNYEIYNKRCTNQKQIYIGDVTDYLWIDSVEYPLGTKRNWKVYNEVLEIDVATVQDSDSTLDPPNDIDVLVRFAKPHRLCQLTDLKGACTAIEPVGETELSLDGLGGTEIIETGDELHIADHRTLYTVTTGATTSANAATIDVFPGMESATADADEVVFVKSTLKPQHEELFCHLVAARCVLSDDINYINAINKGGPEVYARFRDWGERKLGEVLSKLDRFPPRTKRVYTK